METTKTAPAREEENTLLVGRYKAFLKRRAEEHAKDATDLAQQKRIATMQNTLRKRNNERGTTVVTLPDSSQHDY